MSNKDNLNKGYEVMSQSKMSAEEAGVMLAIIGYLSSNPAIKMWREAGGLKNYTQWYEDNKIALALLLAGSTRVASAEEMAMMGKGLSKEEQIEDIARFLGYETLNAEEKAILDQIEALDPKMGKMAKQLFRMKGISKEDLPKLLEHAKNRVADGTTNVNLSFEEILHNIYKPLKPKEILDEEAKIPNEIIQGLKKEGHGNVMKSVESLVKDIETKPMGEAGAPKGGKPPKTEGGGQGASSWKKVVDVVGALSGIAQILPVIQWYKDWFNEHFKHGKDPSLDSCSCKKELDEMNVKMDALLKAMQLERNNDGEYHLREKDIRGLSHLSKEEKAAANKLNAIPTHMEIADLFEKLDGKMAGRFLALQTKLDQSWGGAISESWLLKLLDRLDDSDDFETLFQQFFYRELDLVFEPLLP